MFGILIIGKQHNHNALYRYFFLDWCLHAGDEIFALYAGYLAHTHSYQGRNYTRRVPITGWRLGAESNVICNRSLLTIIDITVEGNFR